MVEYSLLPIYTFLYMKWLQAQMFQFHFTQVYEYKTCNIEQHWYRIGIRIGANLARRLEYYFLGNHNITNLGLLNLFP